MVNEVFLYTLLAFRKYMSLLWWNFLHCLSSVGKCAKFYEDLETGQEIQWNYTCKVKVNVCKRLNCNCQAQAQFRLSLWLSLALSLWLSLRLSFWLYLTLSDSAWLSLILSDSLSLSGFAHKALAWLSTALSGFL